MTTRLMTLSTHQADVCCREACVRSWKESLRIEEHCFLVLDPASPAGTRPFRRLNHAN